MVRTGGCAICISTGSFMEKESGNAMRANSITEYVGILPIVLYYEPIEFDDIVIGNLEV